MKKPNNQLKKNHSHNRKKKAIFFDRDGTLNVDHGYVHNWKDFVWISGAREAIKLCNDSATLVFVVTNQAGVAKGYFEEKAIHTLNKYILEDLASIGAHIDKIEYCPHHPRAIIDQYRLDCPRRKPRPGMLISCIENWHLAAEDCFLVGDKETDMTAAKAAGIKSYLFEGGNLLKFIKPFIKIPPR